MRRQNSLEKTLMLGKRMAEDKMDRQDQGSNKHESGKIHSPDFYFITSHEVLTLNDTRFIYI